MMTKQQKLSELPSSMPVRIMTAVSRRESITAIDATAVYAHAGISADNVEGLREWASENGAYFYTATSAMFSYDIAASEAAANGATRVVLYRGESSKIRHSDR
jgi:hypothetical protein